MPGPWSASGLPCGWGHVREYQAYLGLHERAILGLIARGDVPAAGWPQRIRPRDLDEYVARCRIKPGELSHLDANAGRRPPRGNLDAPLTKRGVLDRRFGRR